MALDIDAVLDRRQLRRKLTFWRIAAFAVLALAIVALLSASGVLGRMGQPGDHIARIEISGPITEDKALLSMIESVKEDERVKGVMVVVDSPGGTMVGGEAIYTELRELAQAKPTVSSVGTLAASAGYMIAVAADHVVARRSSIVGSIGVIFQYPQAQELLDKIGVEVREIKSSPLKAEPSPFHAPPPGAEAVIARIVEEGQNWFVDLVTERRPLDRAEVVRLADGSVYSGGTGLETKLVDALGGEDTARGWLTGEKGVAEDLKVIDWKPKRERDGLSLLGAAASLAGFSWSHAKELLPTALTQRYIGEGLMAVWRAG